MNGLVVFISAFLLYFGMWNLSTDITKNIDKLTIAVQARASP